MKTQEVADVEFPSALFRDNDYKKALVIIDKPYCRESKLIGEKGHVYKNNYDNRARYLVYPLNEQQPKLYFSPLEWTLLEFVE